jgi:RNA polymerase sigma-70 factor (ECF subfamily)
MIDEHINFVARTLRKRGVPRSDLDDEIQKTFMVAAERLDDVEAGAERSFLFKVAHNVAFHARRRHARRREVLDGNPPERIETIATPERLAVRKQLGNVLADMVQNLDRRLRAVFTLFELEDLNLAEISTVLEIPRGTVASRLRRARAQLREQVAVADLGAELPAHDTRQVAEPSRLRRERTSRLQRALLGAGASVRASASAYAHTLAALGLAGPKGIPKKSSQRQARSANTDSFSGATGVDRIEAAGALGGATAGQAIAATGGAAGANRPGIGSA